MGLKYWWETNANALVAVWIVRIFSLGFINVNTLKSNEQKKNSTSINMFRQSPIWFHYMHYHRYLWTQHHITLQLAFILISFAFNVAKKTPWLCGRPIAFRRDCTFKPLRRTAQRTAKPGTASAHAPEVAAADSKQQRFGSAGQREKICPFLNHGDVLTMPFAEVNGE